MKKIVDGAFLSTLETLDLNVKALMNGGFGGNRRSSAYGSSAEFADFREYAAGDDLRRIDWNIYGRFEKLFIKLYVDERQLHHRIYVDTSASMDYGEPKKSYAALRIAAALGFISVQAMDKVSFYALFEDDCEDLCHTVMGKDAFYRAANELNELEFFGDTDLCASIKACENPGKDDGISYIISDFFTESDWQSAVDWLLFKGRQVVLIQVVSRDEIVPGMSGKLQLMDSEAIDDEDLKNFKLEITKTSVKAYSEALEYHENEIRKFCATRGVSFMTVCSDESVERIFFKKGMEAEVVK